DWIIRRYLLKTLRPHFVSGCALELGCYKGDMTEQILEYFSSLTVIEAASDLATLVRQRFPDRVSVITADFANLDLQERYENVFLIHTLEHLECPGPVLARIGQWLAPQGRLFVAVPNANALS